MVLDDKRILVLEDEPIIAMLVEDLMRSLGATDVHREATLAAGRQVMDETAFDAALFDVDLDGESSLALAQEAQRAGTPVVLASGYSHLARDASEQFVVIAKPFTLPKLKTAFLAALNINGD